MSRAFEAMTSPFTREWPPGFKVGHVGTLGKWCVTVPGHPRIFFDCGVQHAEVYAWCWEQHRRLEVTP